VAGYRLLNIRPMHSDLNLIIIIIIIIIIINQGTNARRRRCPMPFSLFDAIFNNELNKVRHFY